MTEFVRNYNIAFMLVSAWNDIFFMLSNIGEGMNQNNQTFLPEAIYVCAKHVIYEKLVCL
jgi:hypothetical protein